MLNLCTLSSKGPARDGCLEGCERTLLQKLKCWAPCSPFEARLAIGVILSSSKVMRLAGQAVALCWSAQRAQEAAGLLRGAQAQGTLLRPAPLQPDRTLAGWCTP